MKGGTKTYEAAMKQVYGLKELECFSDTDLSTLMSGRLGTNMIVISKIMVGEFYDEEGPR